MPNFSVVFLPSLYSLLHLCGFFVCLLLFVCLFCFVSFLPPGHQQVCFLISVKGVCFEENFSPFSYWKNVRNEAQWPQHTTQPASICTCGGGRARCLQALGTDSDPASAAWWGSKGRMAVACAPENLIPVAFHYAKKYLLVVLGAIEPYIYRSRSTMQSFNLF